MQVFSMALRIGCFLNRLLLLIIVTIFPVVGYLPINNRVSISLTLATGAIYCVSLSIKSWGNILLIITEPFLRGLPLARGQAPKNVLHLFRFTSINQVSLAHGELVEVAEAYISTDKSLTTPVVPRGNYCLPYLFQIDVVDEEAHRLVLVYCDILRKRLKIAEGQLFSSQNEVFKRLEIGLLCRTPQINVSYG